MKGWKNYLIQLQDKIAGRQIWTHGIVLFGVIFLILGRLTASTADPDLWGYLSFGRLFWNSDGFPYHDIYAYTPTKDIWVYHEWLTGVIFYPLYVWLGTASLQVMKYILGLGTALLILMTARQRGASLPLAVIGLMLVSPLFGFSYSPVRAQAFTYLFLALTIFILERSKATDNQMQLLWLVPLFPLWANLHGGFIVGLGIIGFYAAGNLVAGRKAGLLILVLGLSAALTFINPYGVNYWVYLVNAVTMPRPDIGEWQSLLWALKNGEYFVNAAYFIFLFAFIIIALLIVETPIPKAKRSGIGKLNNPAKRRARYLAACCEMFPKLDLGFIPVISRRLNITDALLIITTGYLAFRHIRHQSLFFITAGCLLPGYLTAIWKFVENSQEIANRWNKLTRAAIPIFFSLLILIYGFKFLSGHPFTLIASPRSDNSASEYYYPVSAVKYIRSAGIKGNMLTEFDWGEYIIWELNGNCRVAIDGRYETVYPEYVSREYFEFAAGGPDLRKYLDKYPHDLILLQHDNYICEIIRKQSDWKQIYIDADSVLFMRDKK